jgi:hypothetical protein
MSRSEKACKWLIFLYDIFLAGVHIMASKRTREDCFLARAVAASGDWHDHFDSENLNLLQQNCTCSSLPHKLHEMFDLSCPYMVEEII